MVKISVGTGSVPKPIYDVLKDELGLSHAEIEITSPKERFNMYCNWEGLINYGDKLWELVIASL